MKLGIKAGVAVGTAGVPVMLEACGAKEICGNSEACGVGTGTACNGAAGTGIFATGVLIPVMSSLLLLPTGDIVGVIEGGAAVLVLALLLPGPGTGTAEVAFADVLLPLNAGGCCCCV